MSKRFDIGEKQRRKARERVPYGITHPDKATSSFSGE